MIEVTEGLGEFRKIPIFAALYRRQHQSRMSEKGVSWKRSQCPSIGSKHGERGWNLEVG